jgi:hypothetical protein
MERQPTYDERIAQLTKEVGAYQMSCREFYNCKAPETTLTLIKLQQEYIDKLKAIHEYFRNTMNTRELEKKLKVQDD